MNLQDKHLENLKKWVDDGDYCFLCDNHPSSGHSEDCPLNDAVQQVRSVDLVEAYANLLPLLEECLENGNAGESQLYAWFSDQANIIEQAIEDARLDTPTRTQRAFDGASACRVIEHVYIDGACARCGTPEQPRKE